MSLILDGSAGVTFPNSTVQASAGSILQTVTSQITSSASTTSLSPVTTGLSASITPKFATSKILATCVTGAGYNNTSSSALYLSIYRNGSNLAGANPMAAIYNGGSSIESPMTCVWLDSPATTSSTTYTLYYWVTGGTGSISNASTATTFILQEIAA